MTSNINEVGRRNREPRKVFESILTHFGIYFVPIAIFIASVYALAFLPDQYHTDGASIVEFRVYKDINGRSTPAEALADLAGNPAVRIAETKLAEDPFWLLFSPPNNDSVPRTIEFPSRHADTVTCWHQANLQAPIGTATRNASTGALRAAKAGFILEQPSSQEPGNYLCKTTYTGPAKIEIFSWPSENLATSIQKYHRSSGLLEGSFIALSLFVFMFAIINREWTYVLFSGWLVFNLRVAALSAGWDSTWLEGVIPLNWISNIRQLAMSGYIALTAALFSRLFRDELQAIDSPKAQTLMTGVSVLALIEAITLPYNTYLPFMWVTGSIGIAALCYLLVRILTRSRSRVAIWYSLSMAMNVATSLYEIIAASFGFRQYIGALNNVSGAIASSLLAAIAIAEHLRQARVARNEAQAVAFNALQKFKDTYKAIPIGLFTIGPDGQFTQLNPACRSLLSISPDQSTSITWHDHFEKDDWKRIYPAFTTKGEIELELPCRKTDGARWYIVKASAKDGALECSLQDVTEARLATRKLEFLANHDPLTNLPNRRGIESALSNAIAGSTVEAPGALAYIDLNRFKLINDLYGHVIGDDVLSQVADRLRQGCPESVEIGRIGGDEFIVVFPKVSVRTANEYCAEIAAAIDSNPFVIGQKAFKVGAAFGTVELGNDFSIRDALATADRACREAKENGRTLISYEQNTSELAGRISELRMLERIGHDVPLERMFLEMQPIMSLTDPYGSLNCEVLIRMRESDGMLVPPGKFLGAAEKNGQMTVIDRWVIESTLQWVEANLSRLINTQFICLNLSGASINDERFLHDVFSLLQSHANAAKMLCFEITEDVALRDLRNTRRFIDQLKNLGARVALDDFGAGYTSFNYLKELPADALKVDGQFVREINRHPANYAIIRAIVDLARQLGMKSIAEWAEDAQAVESLIEIGADYVQGWAIAKAQSPEIILSAQSCGSFVTSPELISILKNQQTNSRELAQLQRLDYETNRMH